MTLSRDDFDRQVAELYQHLYDMVYLRTHPLMDVLVPDPDARRKDKAWQLHEMLLDVIEELDPGPQAPAFSREWRRHRLMVQRYKNGMEPQAVYEEIAVSRRQFYREHRAALEAVADILWGRYVVHPTSRQTPQTGPKEQSLSHLELLRLEAARVAQTSRYVSVDKVVKGVLALLEERLRARELAVHKAFAEPLPGASVEKGLLRQLLLGTIGYLVERASQATLCLVARSEEANVHLSLTVDPPEAVRPADPERVRERLAAFEDMATLGDAQVQPIYERGAVVGFQVRLSADPRRTVLVVDDNEDVLQFFQRLLIPHGYRVGTAQNVQEALDLVNQLQPHVITLDLMMPEQDGWDLLQTLLNRPDTQHIPIIVCSVLKQKELALSLGATAFLEKPITEQALLATLAALEGA